MPTSTPAALAPLPPLRLWLRDWGGLLTLLTGLFSLGAALTMAFQLGDASARVWLGNLSSIGITLVAIILAWRVTVQDKLDARSRWAWRVLALAFALNGIGSVAWFIFESILQTYPAVSLADVGWLGFYPVLLVAILLFPTAPRGRSEQATFWLDAATVLLGGGMLVWFFSIGPRASAESASNLLLIISLAYPVGDLVTLFALATVALRRPDPRTAWALRLIALGICFNIAANLGYTYTLIGGSYATGQWPSAGWALAFFLFGTSAQVQYWQTTRQTMGMPIAQKSSESMSLLPYVGILVGYGLLLGVTYQNWTRPLGDLILAAGALTGLVIVRQVIAVRENVRLAAERNAAAQASQLKSEFLANMSHELRTPLNSIINFTRILKSGIRGPVTAEQTDYLNRVQQSGEHLLGLINDILDLSKIEAGRLELVKETLHIDEIIRSVMTSATGLIKEKSIELRQEPCMASLTAARPSSACASYSRLRSSSMC